MVVFHSDDLSSGDFSKATGIFAGPGSTIAITSQVVHSSPYGVELTRPASDVDTYYYKDFSNPSSRTVCVEAWFYFDYFTGSGNNMNLLGLMTTTGKRVAELSILPTNYQLNLGYFDDSEMWHDKASATSLMFHAWNRVTIKYVAGTTGVNNGELHVYLNGVELTDAAWTGIACHYISDMVWFGNKWHWMSAGAAHYYFDDLIVTDRTQILTITASTGGTTDPSPGTYIEVQPTVNVTGIPKASIYHLDYWTVDGVLQLPFSNPITVTMDADHSLTGCFIIGYIQVSDVQAALNATFDGAHTYTVFGLNILDASMQAHTDYANNYTIGITGSTLSVTDRRYNWAKMAALNLASLRVLVAASGGMLLGAFDYRLGDLYITKASIVRFAFEHTVQALRDELLRILVNFATPVVAAEASAAQEVPSYKGGLVTP